ncbi:MAG: AAA family ATPase [Deltaproteobacteria bacterium]|nr:AAA family ATPase [Deltaproteobacteria bacterium]
MYRRDIEQFLGPVAEKYPVITLLGPRQSGKSTLARSFFPDYTYVSLETPDDRTLAEGDPRGFFKKFPAPVVIDEIQRVPELLSYIQTFVDEPGFKQKFVLTGSQQLLLMEKVTQSLAGRTVIAKLLPFSYEELLQKPDHPALQEIDTLIFTGSYPRIYDKDLSPRQWLEQYFQTYVERDARSLLNIERLDLFDRFIGLFLR